MNLTTTPGLRRASLLAVLFLASGTHASAQPDPPARSTCNDVASTKQLFTGTLRGFEHLRSGDSLGIAVLGGLAAIGAYSADGSVPDGFTRPKAIGDTFKSGAVVGGAPLQLGAGLATYGLARAFNKPCAAQLGADLIQAQLMAQMLTFSVKQATRRSRPEGSGFSFPSGHTATSFASATVLQRHFGWRVGVPAYAVASYVAASRVQMKRHYLSDVAFGAALGIVAGRSITVGRSHQLRLAPLVVPDGAGMAFSWAGKR